MHLCVPAFLLSLLQNQKNSHCQPEWTVVSIFPQTHINIKTIPGGYELKRQNIYVHFFPILLSGFLLVYFLLLLNICGGLFYAKHYVILIYIVRSFSCQKRRHSIWDWIPNGRKPQAHEQILDNQNHFGTVTWWSLCDLISAKIFSEKSILLGT